MFSLNCHCLSRLSRVQDCRNGISMELFLHLSLLPAVSASVLRSQPREIDNPPLDLHTCAVCIYSCLLVLPGFHHSGSLIPPEESQQVGIRQQTAIPGRSIRRCGVRSPHKRVSWNHAVELIPHIGHCRRPLDTMSSLSNRWSYGFAFGAVSSTVLLLFSESYLPFPVPPWAKGTPASWAPGWDPL